MAIVGPITPNTMASPALTNPAAIVPGAMLGNPRSGTFAVPAHWFGEPHRVRDPAVIDEPDKLTDAVGQGDIDRRPADCAEIQCDRIG